MTALNVSARLIDLLTNTVVATTHNIIAADRGWGLDIPGTLSVSVPLGDYGDAGAVTGAARAVVAFQGGDDYAALSLAATQAVTPTSGDYTIEFWATSGSAQANSPVDILSCGNSGTFTGWGIEGQNGPWWPYDYFIGTGSAFHQASFSLPPGGWHHVAIVYHSAATVLTVYVDGVQQTRVVANFSPAMPDAVLEFGNSPDFGGFNTWPGRLANVRISARQRYTGAFMPSMTLAAPDSDTIAQWPCDDGSGTTLSDQTAGAHDATFHGTTTHPAWVTDRLSPLWGTTGFASALLAAVGGADGSSTPVPTMLELSLGGLWNVDGRKIVEQPTLSLPVAGGQLTEAGDDIWAFYATVGVDRATYTDCSLIDVLGKDAGTIVPLDATNWGLTANGFTPFMRGLFVPVDPAHPYAITYVPGNAAWPAEARNRLSVTAIVAPRIAFLPTNVDIYADYVLKAIGTIVQRLGGVYMAGDSAPLGSRGHYVADMSDPALNISGSISGYIADGTPTRSAPGPECFQEEIGPALAVGNVGQLNSGGFLEFIAAEGDAQVDETTQARILTEQAAMTTDLTTLYGMASFIGGNSSASFPANGKITGMTMIHNVPPGTRDAWTDCLPVISVSVNNTSGGLYFYMGDGQFHPFPNWPSNVPINAMYLDGTGNGDGWGILYCGTPHGIYTRSANPTNTTDVWTLLGGLSVNVTRLSGEYDLSNALVLYALVTGAPKGTNGIYRYPALSTPVTGAGYDGWSTELIAESIVDMVATDYQTFFVVTKANQNVVLQYTANHPTTPLQHYALPAGVLCTKLEHVITAGTPSSQSIWAITTGDNVGLYTLPQHPTGTWNAFIAGNFPGTTRVVTFPGGSTQTVPACLVGPTGKPLQVSRVVGLGLTINGVDTAMFACTNNGLYYSTTTDAFGNATGADWTSANGQNGLDGVPIGNIGAGQQQNILGQSTNRLFAANYDSQFFVSNTSAVWWEDVTRAKLDLGPYFSALVETATGDLPNNKLLSIGPMPTSPIVGITDNTTHLQIAGSLPDGWYWMRAVDERLNFVYRLVNGTVPFTSLMYAQLSDLETNEAVPIATASAQLAYVMLRWLGENSIPQTILTLPSSFTTQEAALRRLRPSHTVGVTMTGSIAQVDAAGAVVSTHYVQYTNKQFYVLSHSFALATEGGSQCTTMTTLGTALRTSILSPDDIVASLMDSIKAVKVFGAR